VTVLGRFHERRQQLLAELCELGDLARGLGACTLGAHIESELVAKLEADRFHLVVMGEFNHGKTTLINALLGAEVLPVGVTPTTGVIHHVVYGAEPRARVVYATGAEEPIPMAELQAFGVGGPRATAGIRYLEVSHPAALLGRGVVLVDTPGVNDLSLTRAEVTYEYVPRADAVLFVLDAGQPVKESERLFLRDRLIAKSRDKIVFVVAKVDIWSPTERAEALDYVRQRLAGLVPDPVVFAVSADAALAGAQATGLGELSQYLQAFLARERGRILLDNVLADTTRTAEVLRRGIGARQRAARMSVEQVAARRERLERDLAGEDGELGGRRALVREEGAAIKAWARRDWERFCDDVLADLGRSVETSSGSEVRQHLGAYLEHQLRSWATRETQEIAAALESLGERVAALLREDAHEVGQRVSEAMGADLSPPRIELDTFAYDAEVFAVLSFGLGMLFANALLGGLLLAAAPALALWNRDRTDAEIRRRALELAPRVLGETAAKVALKMDEMIDQYASRLEAWVVAAGEELHREMIEVLAEVERSRVGGAANAEAELEQGAELARRLDAWQTRLKALREPMQQPAGET
jgi:small GTP-binding protein